MWMAAVVAYLRHYSANRLEEIRKAKRNVAQHSCGSSKGSKICHLNTSPTLKVACQISCTCTHIQWLISTSYYIQSHITHVHHHHKHQGLDPLIRSVSRVTAARANASSVFQLFSFLVVCRWYDFKGIRFCGILCKCESQFRLYSSILSSMPVIRSSRSM